MPIVTPAALVLLTGCAIVTDVAIAPADTPGQQVYRAAGVVEASAEWVQVYVLQARADPIAVASMVDSVRVARAAELQARKALGQGGGDAGQPLSVVGEAVLGLVMVAEAAEGIAAPSAASGTSGLALTLVDDATIRMERLGAARARLADLRSRLSVMTSARRDPSAEEWAEQDKALSDAFAALLRAAHLPEEE